MRTRIILFIIIMCTTSRLNAADEKYARQCATLLLHYAQIFVATNNNIKSYEEDGYPPKVEKLLKQWSGTTEDLTSQAAALVTEQDRLRAQECWAGLGTRTEARFYESRIMAAEYLRKMPKALLTLMTHGNRRSKL